MKIVFFIILFFSVTASPLLARERIHAKVDENDAIGLVRIALGSNDFDFALASDSSDQRHYFLMFPELGLNGDTVGLWAVNAWTGDVWETWECKRIDTPELNKQLLVIKARYSEVELKEYESLRKLRPESMMGDKDYCEAPD